MQFPLPTMEDVFDCVGNAKPKFFTCLDCANGYWQVPVEEGSKEKTAFVTHHGQFQFQRMPFGLANAPASYQMTMMKALAGMSWKYVLVYIDDVIIFSKTFEDHLGHIANVFDRLRKAGMTLKPSKCRFAVGKVLYLGHFLSKAGIEVDPSKTEAVSSFPVPKTLKQLRGFLGMANYYRRFIEGMSKRSAPLNELLKKDTKFAWTDRQQNAFDDIKKALTSAPVLVYPDVNKPFVLTTDASDEAIGFILGQKDDQNRERVIAYGGRAIRENEKSWSTTHKEGLAVVEGVNTFHQYLANNQFEIITDHSALLSILNNKSDKGKLTRWRAKLLEYNYTIKHRPGRVNENADALSRRQYTIETPTKESNDECLSERANPLPDKQKSISVINQEEVGSIRVDIKWLLDTKHLECVSQIETIQGNQDQELWHPEQLLGFVAEVQCDDRELPKQQRECPETGPLYSYLVDGILPSEERAANKLAIEAQQYGIQNEALYHIYTSRGKNRKKIHQLVVPEALRPTLMAHYHDSALGGHQGPERTYNGLQLKYFWRNMYRDSFEYASSCDQCQKAKRTGKSNRAPLHPMPIAGPFERWHMDFLGPLRTKSAYKHILLVVDSYTRWCEAIPMETQEAKEVAQVFFDQIIARYGAPRSLVTDRGQNFMSKIVAALCELFGIRHTPTTAYHPQTNAACERMNSTIGQTLRAYCQEHPEQWPTKLQSVMLAYRRTPANRSTGISPYHMVFGREMVMPIDTVLCPADENAPHPSEWIQQLKENLKIAHELANTNLQEQQVKNKEAFDKKAREPKFQVGDQVLLHCPKVPKHGCAKLHAKWTGPYYITQAQDNHTYKLSHSGTHQALKGRVHANRIKIYRDPIDRTLHTEQLTQLPEENEGNAAPQEIVENEGNAAPQQTVENEGKAAPQGIIEKKEATPTTDSQYYIVEKVLKCKKIKGKRQYLIKWKNSPEKTWEPEQNLGPGLQRDFHTHFTWAGKAKKINCEQVNQTQIKKRVRFEQPRYVAPGRSSSMPYEVPNFPRAVDTPHAAVTADFPPTMILKSRDEKGRRKYLQQETILGKRQWVLASMVPPGVKSQFHRGFTMSGMARYRKHEYWPPLPSDWFGN